MLNATLLTCPVEMKNRIYLLGFLCLAFFDPITIAVVNAALLPPYVDVALYFSRQDVQLNYGQQDIHTTVKQLGIVSFDISQETLQPGLAVGYASITDGDQAITAGMVLEGFYITPILRSVLLKSPRFSASLDASYLYQQVKDSNSDNSVTLEWQQPQLALDVKYRFSRQISLLLGGQYGRIDVDEQVTGGVNQTLTLKTGATLGYRAGLEIDLGDRGQIGMLLNRFSGDGLSLYFRQQF